MIRNFFQSLNEHQVAYLLISGQATVLYGAATFSEDIDLWIEPGAENSRAFLKALASQGARYYKLTPPFEPAYLARGHGFHFIFGGESEEVFLDVMGMPPRVPDFQTAARSAAWMESDWGRLHTIGIKDLVELKKTQRMEDYPVISKLALEYLNQPGCLDRENSLSWAASNLFTLSSLTELFQNYRQALGALGPEFPVALKSFGEQALAGKQPEPGLEKAVNLWMQERAIECQSRDRQYWRSIIQELRNLRASDQLQQEGSPVLS
jgi:hypothetical protein